MGPRLYGLSAFGSSDPEDGTTLGDVNECATHSHLLIWQLTATAINMTTSIPIDGYGFRKSGVSTPQLSEQISDRLQPICNLVPDPNGLGWPGTYGSF